ncbi:MAG: recombinase RecT [Peptoanaerobacter stomatis]|uniref:recombinase RecT n=1 Tax=Peptoanaerobacter stomatis TaxID=796937 RepID=UPI003FA0D005
MSNEIQKSSTAISPINQMKELVNNGALNKMFKDALKENSGAFLSSLIDLYNSDTNLQKCKAKDVIMEALKAATLKLPINKQLGFAYIVPYKDVPQFQLGYKGYIQLAMRTGQYQNLNAGIIYEGMEIKNNYLAGTIEIHGDKQSDNEIGYFAYFKLINGFEKCLYMSKEDITKHAQKFSKTYSFKGSSWQTNFSAMALKTVTRLLLSKYGILSTEMQTAITNEADQELGQEIEQKANKTVIDIADYNNDTHDIVDIETGEVIQQDEPKKDEIKKAPF